MYEMAGQEVSAFDPGAGQLSQLYQLMPGVMTPYQVSRSPAVVFSSPVQ